MTKHKIKAQEHNALDHALLPIEKYITDNSITEVCINQPHGIHIERR